MCTQFPATFNNYVIVSSYQITIILYTSDQDSLNKLCVYSDELIALYKLATC